MAKIFINDVGTIVLIDMQQDISDATSVSLMVVRPNGTNTTWTPTVFNSNFLRYVIVAHDLEQAGDYILQPLLTIGGWSGSGDPVKMTVVKQIV